MATKIYTKTGDDGTTGLFGGDRVPKYHLRIEAYGTLDELNSLLGVVLALDNAGNNALPNDSGISDELDSAIATVLASNKSNNALPSDMHTTLIDISALLFTAGADLATPLDPPPAYPIPRIEAQHTEFLERCIDLYEQELEPLKAFILPTGTPAAAYLHLARTVCRRAERLAVHLAQEDNIGDEILKFLNRLSDYCFTAARLANKRAGVADVAWKNPALAV